MREPFGGPASRVCRGVAIQSMLNRNQLAVVVERKSFRHDVRFMERVLTAASRFLPKLFLNQHYRTELFPPFRLQFERVEILRQVLKR